MEVYKIRNVRIAILLVLNITSFIALHFFLSNIWQTFVQLSICLWWDDVASDVHADGDDHYCVCLCVFCSDLRMMLQQLLWSKTVNAFSAALFQEKIQSLKFLVTPASKSNFIYYS